MDHPPLTQWRDSAPSEAGSWLAGATTPWWIAGGWAVDLHLGRRTRPHGDLDVGCFRDDLARLRPVLADWTLYAAHQGALSRLGPAAEAVPDHVNSIWCHPARAGAWWLEILLDTRDGSDWVFRRCARVRRPAAALALVAADGTPYLRPEVQLLYKAKAARAKDEADLHALLPALGAEERAWLTSALATWEPGHVWLPRLRAAG